MSELREKLLYKPKHGYDRLSAAEEQETPQQMQDTGVTIPKGYKLVKENKSQRMQLLVRPTLKDAIRAEAEAQGGISMNDLVNNILEEYLERKGKA